MKKRFRIITLGCKVNQYESAYIGGGLRDTGWVMSKSYKPCDAVIINTCIVTRKAAHQSRQAIRRAIRENPNALVAAVGCYAQVYPQELAQIPGLKLIAGNSAKARVPELLSESAQSPGNVISSQAFPPSIRFEPLPLKEFPGRSRAYLKIQDGCESFCSYCIVPFARGPYRSLPPKEVLYMLEHLSTKGYKEVVLTGIHIGKYGVDLDQDIDLTALLRVIGREGFSLRIRLSSIEPNEVHIPLIETVLSEDGICPHFHLSLQSGDSHVLELMNRDISPKAFTKLIQAIRRRSKLTAIGVDIMAGFPQEDESAHQNTCSLLEDLDISYLHVFPFSPREGTQAATMQDQNDSKVIKKRATELRKLGQKKRQVFYRACLNNEFSVLAQERDSDERGKMKGLSDNYLPVVFPSPPGSKNLLFNVHIDEIRGDFLTGSLQEENNNYS